MSDYEIVRTQGEIDDQLNYAQDGEESGQSRWPGMSYEAGVSQTIRWLLGWDDSAPMDD